MAYANRKEQIERDLMRRMLREIRKAGGVVTLNAKATRALKEGLCSVAMVGACEERDRTLRLIERNPDVPNVKISEAVVRIGVLDVLGYDV